MKKTFKYCLIVLVLTNIHSCKKTKLTNDLSYLVGTWQWIGGYEDGMNTTYQLKFSKNGVYNLCAGSKKIEHGRINYDANYLKFTSDNLFKSRVILNQTSIKDHFHDTIIITRIGFTNPTNSTFVKK